jgi:hypothetical protein
MGNVGHLAARLTRVGPLTTARFVTLAPSYAADVSPVGLRSFLTAYVQMCFAIGQMVGAAILYW